VRVRCLIALGVAALPVAALAGAERAPPASPIRTLEERVSGLRDKLAPANARLRDLQEKIGAELAASARAVLVHRNELGTTYELESASYAIDGVGPDRPRTPAFPLARARKVLDRRVAAGAHRVSAELVFRVRAAGGDGAPRRLEVRSSYAFDARPGAVTRVTLVTHERAAAVTDEERAAVRFELAVQHEEPGEGAPAGDATSVGARP
jgi:hypothetical protein